MKTRRPAKTAVRAVRRRLGDALVVLESLGPLEIRVHDARRNLRKARAAVKLLRSTVSRRRRRAVNEACRDAGRLLGPTRDAEAAQRAWEKLRVEQPAVARALEKARARAEALFSADPDALDQVRELTCRALVVAGGLKPRQADGSGVLRGLRRGFRRARRARDAAAKNPEAGSFHAWRKRVKEQRYQLELFAGDAEPLAALSRRLRALAEVLGDEHDLALLDAPVRGKPAAAAAVAARRALLRRKAFSLARKIYALDEKDFARRVARSWKAPRDLEQ